jgi:hypothetical protein
MRTFTAIALIIMAAGVVATSPVLAASPAPTPSPAPTAAPPASASETQFVGAVTTDLQARFATTGQAAAAGYFRYTDEDQTGAISWVNTQYWQSDPKNPSQLWYDANGKLIGADFSVLQSGSKARPLVWGISPSRWIDFSPAHLHFGVKTASGVAYGGVGPKSLKLVGATIDSATASDIVKLGKTTRWKVLEIPAPQSASDVAFVFPFPAVWDLQVWLVANPLGAFAEHNPNVKPSANAKNQD